jgi:hypothetical protein
MIDKSSITSKISGIAQKIIPRYGKIICIKDARFNDIQIRFHALLCQYDVLHYFLIIYKKIYRYIFLDICSKVIPR